MHLFDKKTKPNQKQEILFVQCFQCHSFLFRCCFIPTLLFKFWVFFLFVCFFFVIFVMQASLKKKLKFSFIRVMLCTYYSKAIFISSSVWQSILQICCILKPLGFNANISAEKKKKRKKKKARSGWNLPALKSQTDSLRFVSARSGWGIHLPHWLSLLMAKREEGMEGRRRKWCVGVREGHSGPAALGAEEPGSASPPNRASSCFQENMTSKWTWLCPVRFKVSGVWEREVPTSQSGFCQK